MSPGYAWEWRSDSSSRHDHGCGTSILIDHLRGVSTARDRLASAAGSVLTRLEVLAGMRRSVQDLTARLLDVLDWVDVDVPIADPSGELANRFMRSHPAVDPVDDGTVEALQASLRTRNVKHFAMFPNLAAPE